MDGKNNILDKISLVSLNLAAKYQINADIKSSATSQWNKSTII